MPSTTPLIGAPYGQPGDNIGDVLEVDDLALTMEKYTNLRFSSTAARDAAIPVPEWGMTAVIGSSSAARYRCWYDGATWRRASPVSGLSSAATDVNGLVTITHGLGYTPAAFLVTVANATDTNAIRRLARCSIPSLNSTQAQVLWSRSDTGAVLGSNAIPFYWAAMP